MKIRGKLLILLLVIAVTPLLFTAFYGFVTVRNMGNTLADKTGEAMQARMKHQLELMIQYNAQMLRQRQELVAAWLKLLADDAEEALARKDPASEPAYLAEDFDHGRVPQHQLHPSSRHYQLLPSGATATSTGRKLASDDRMMSSLRPQNPAPCLVTGKPQTTCGPASQCST